MGSFANAVLRALLSWVRMAADWIWHLAENQGGESLFAWLGRNWLGLTIALCAAGMLVDGVVHWFRWRPFEVWKSFFRRMHAPKDTDGNEQVKVRRWVYADGSKVVERRNEPENSAASPSGKEPHRRSDRKNNGIKLKLPAFFQEDDPADQPISFRPAPPARDKEEAYGKPFYPTNWKENEDQQSK